MALTPAEKQKAYRDRKRAAKMAPIIAARRAQEELERAKAEVERLEREAAELAARQAAEARRKAEEEAKARGIADGTLHPSGRPWRNGDVRGYDATSPRAMGDDGGRKEGRARVRERAVRQDRRARARPGRSETPARESRGANPL